MKLKITTLNFIFALSGKATPALLPIIQLSKPPHFSRKHSLKYYYKNTSNTAQQQITKEWTAKPAYLGQVKQELIIKFAERCKNN